MQLGEFYVLYLASLPEEIREELVSLKVGSALRKLQGSVPQNEVSYTLLAFHSEVYTIYMYMYTLNLSYVCHATTLECLR